MHCHIWVNVILYLLHPSLLHQCLQLFIEIPYTAERHNWWYGSKKVTWVLIAKVIRNRASRSNSKVSKTSSIIVKAFTTGIQLLKIRLLQSQGMNICQVTYCIHGQYCTHSSFQFLTNSCLYGYWKYKIVEDQNYTLFARFHNFVLCWKSYAILSKFLLSAWTFAQKLLLQFIKQFLFPIVECYAKI
jgi:hypothetical protein